MSRRQPTLQEVWDSMTHEQKMGVGRAVELVWTMDAEQQLFFLFALSAAGREKR